MELLCVGKIIKPQGIKGEVKIFPLVDIPAIFNGKHEFFINKKPVKTKSCTFRLGYAYATFDVIPDRNTAEKYRNSLIYIDKEEFYKIPSNQFLIDDLVGQILYDEKSDYVGQIMGVENFGFDDIVIVKEGERLYQIPFVSAIFKTGDKTSVYVIRKEYEGAKTDYENWCFNFVSRNVHSTSK